MLFMGKSTIYTAGLKHRMTIWKSLGVSEKLTCSPPGPKPHVFELFFRLENLEWVTEMLRNTAPVSQNRSGTRNIEWVFAHSWHTADFLKKIGHNSKSTRHSKFGSQVLFFVEGSPKSFENVFFEHIFFCFFICYSFPRIFPAVFHPFFIHSALISSHIHPLSSVLHPCFIHNLYPLPIHYSLFSPIKFNSV